MTMDKMVEEFEKKGFKASKKYEYKEKHYRFEIEKEGICEIGYFVYRPSGEPYTDFVTRQRNFINTLINSWEETKAAKTNNVSFDNELFRRGGRAYICLETGDSLGIPVCIERIDYTPDTLPSFEGHFCDILSECHVTKTGNSQITIKEDKDNTMKIKVVHFSGGVTTVIWEDGTKSQVRCQEGDEFDPEKGLALAIAKRVLGNKGSWYDEIKKWTGIYRAKELEYAIKKVQEMFGPIVIDNLEFTTREDGGATFKYVGPQDSDEAKRMDEENKSTEPATPTTDTTPKPTSSETPNGGVHCSTCKHIDTPVTQIPCSGCDWHYSCWEASEEVVPPVESNEPQTTHYNPVEEAYNIALKIRDGKYGSIEEIIGFLGEALEK